MAKKRKLRGASNKNLSAGARRASSTKAPAERAGSPAAHAKGKDGPRRRATTLQRLTITFRKHTNPVTALIALIANITSVITCSAGLRLAIGITTIAAGITGFACWLRRRVPRFPRSVTAMLIVGVVFTAIGAPQYRADQKAERRQDLVDTCNAAADYRESSTAALAILAASGRVGDGYKSAIQAMNADLESLTRAANRSKSAEAKALAHEIRAQRAAADGVVDLAKIPLASSASMKSSVAFSKLVGLCNKAGDTMAAAVSPGVEPTVADACANLQELVSMAEDSERHFTNDEIDQYLAAAILFFYHALRVDDNVVRQGAEDVADDLTSPKKVPTEATRRLFTRCKIKFKS